MPLLKIFSCAPLRMDVASVHQQLCKSWGVPSELSTTPLDIFILVQPGEVPIFPKADCFVDIRVKAKPERTPEYLEERMEELTEIVRQAMGNPSAVVRVRITLLDAARCHSKRFGSKL